MVLHVHYLIEFKEMKLELFYFLVLVLILGLMACTEDPPENPFNSDVTNGVDTIHTDTINYPNNSLVGLQNNVFSPTCANSGCHDGTFEPDFRTIESTYNTLIYHPIIKNDPLGSYKWRVVPYDADRSILMARLSFDIDGQSGIMPLESGDSDWDLNSERYIEDVRSWINNGAPDVLGNTYSPVDNSPSINGVSSSVNGATLSRADGGAGPLMNLIGNRRMEIYFSIHDDNTTDGELTNLKVEFSRGPVFFNDSISLNLSPLPSNFTGVGYGEEVVEYNFMTALDYDLDTLFNTSQVYMRVFANDGVNPTVQAPSETSARYIRRYFSIINPE
jgi:hypothetical protein